MPKGHRLTPGRMTRLAQSARLMVRLLGGALASVFTFLQLRNVPFAKLANDESANYIFQGLLIIYYAGWIFGTIMDTKDIERVYLTAPHKGRLPKMAVLLATTIAVLFGVLCWVKTPQQFVIAFSGFWLLSLGGWFYVVRYLLKDAGQASLKKYSKESDLMGLVKFRLVEKSICGSWQLRRYAVGGLLLVYLHVQVNTDLPVLIARIRPGLSIEFIQVAALAVVILGLEIWVWLHRIKRRAGLNVLDELEDEEKYQFNRIQKNR